MTRIITLTKRETTHVQDLRVVIEREKLEILKLLAPTIFKKHGISHEDLIKKYINSKN